MEELKPLLVELGITAITGLLGLVTIYASLYLKKATASLKAQVKLIENEQARLLFENAISDLDMIANKTVSAIEQTTAASLREAVKDRSVSKNELLNLANEAKEQILNQLSTDTYLVLTKNIDDFNTYLKNTIEEKVLEVKHK